MPLSPLSIAVVGAGGIGSAFACRLAQAGHNLTVIGRPQSTRLAQLQTDQGIVDSDGVKFAMQVADQLDEQIAYDLVLVTLLAHQVDAVLPSLQRSKATSIQFMFNNFNPERLKKALSDHQVSFGMPFLMATIDKEGKLHSKINPGQKTLHGNEKTAELFEQAGISSQYEADMMLWLRCHAPVCIAMESISVAGQRRGGGASWAESMLVARGLLGAYAIIKGLGYRIYPQAKTRISTSPTWLIASILWFLSRIKSFRELLATGKNECRALIDEIISQAVKANVILPNEIAALLPAKPD